MIFNNLDELEIYVKKANEKAIKEIAEKQTKVVKDEIYKQVYLKSTAKYYKHTGDTYNNVQYQIKGNIIETVLEDTGSWHSVFKPYKPMYAFDMLEAGKTWKSIDKEGNITYRPQTHIAETVEKKLKKEIPLVYKKAMREQGIKIR